MESETAPTKLLKDALVMLSLAPTDQLCLNSPGCLTCDMHNDFALGRQLVEEGQIQVTTEQRRKLEDIQRMLDAVPDEDWECFSPEHVTRPSWQAVREAALSALPAFGWEDAIVPPFTETSHGVWTRPPATNSVTIDQNIKMPAAWLIVSTLIALALYAATIVLNWGRKPDWAANLVPLIICYALLLVTAAIWLGSALHLLTALFSRMRKRKKTPDQNALPGETL